MSRSDQARIGPPCGSAGRRLPAQRRVVRARSRAYLMYASSSIASCCSCVADTSVASPAQLGTAAEYVAAANRSQPRGKAGLRERGPRRMRARGNERAGKPHGVQGNQRNPGRRVHALRQTRFGECDSPLARRARILLHGRPRGRPRGCSAALPAHQRGLLACSSAGLLAVHQRSWNRL